MATLIQHLDFLNSYCSLCSALAHPQSLPNTEARPILLKHTHSSKPHDCFPSHSRVKAQGRARPAGLALHELVCWSAVTAPKSSPLLPFTHSTPATKASLFCTAGCMPTSGPLHLVLPLECSSPRWQSHFLISFGSLLKSASQQGLLWSLLKFHFPVSCCLSLPNHCLTFKAYFSSMTYHEKFQTHTKVERSTW